VVAGPTADHFEWRELKRSDRERAPKQRLPHVVPHDGLVAAYELSRDTAPDSSEGHGQVNGGT